jgi:hypothetical protein
VLKSTRFKKFYRSIPLIVICLYLNLAYCVQSFALQTSPSLVCDSDPITFSPSVFQWRFYLQHNPDLIAQGLLEPEQACTHWITQGIAQGRQAHPGFWTIAYLEQQNALATQVDKANYLAAIGHYVAAQNTRPSPSTKTTLETAPTTNSPTLRTISMMLNGQPLWLSASKRNAGAIDSLVWGNQELINSFDHGRELQIAFAKSSSGECFNPTEAGSQWDAKKRTLNNNQGKSSSVLLDWSQTENQIRTSSIPAYWMAPSQKKPRSCGPAQNTSITANDTRLYKTVTLQAWQGAALISFETRIELLPSTQTYEPTGKEGWSIAFEVPTGYLAPQLNQFYSLNPKTGQFLNQNARAKDCLAPRANISCEQEYPIVVAKNPQVAMGICTAPAGVRFLDPAYGVFAIADQGSSLANTTKWNVVQRALGRITTPDAFSFRTNIVIGTQAQVQTGLLALFKNGTCRLAQPRQLHKGGDDSIRKLMENQFLPSSR